jgi:hypothetical protein
MCRALWYSLDAFAKLRKLTISYVMSVCPSAWNSTPTGRIIYIMYFSKICWKKIQVSLKSNKNNGTLHDDLCTFMIISAWILLRVRKVSDKNCKQNQNTHFMFNNLHSHPQNRAVCKKMRKNMVEADRPCTSHVGKLRLDTHSKYVILITVLRQQWLRERAWILRYT